MAFIYNYLFPNSNSSSSVIEPNKNLEKENSFLLSPQKIFSSLAATEEIVLTKSSFSGFQEYLPGNKEIKHLKLVGLATNLDPELSPNGLESISIKSCDQITNDNLSDFVNKNPEAISLKLVNCAKLTDEFFNKIKVPKVENLVVKGFNESRTEYLSQFIKDHGSEIKTLNMDVYLPKFFSEGLHLENLEDLKASQLDDEDILWLAKNCLHLKSLTLLNGEIASDLSGLSGRVHRLVFDSVVFSKLEFSKTYQRLNTLKFYACKIKDQNGEEAPLEMEQIPKEIRQNDQMDIMFEKESQKERLIPSDFKGALGVSGEDMGKLLDKIYKEHTAGNDTIFDKVTSLHLNKVIIQTDLPPPYQDGIVNLLVVFKMFPNLKALHFNSCIKLTPKFIEQLSEILPTQLTALSFVNQQDLDDSIIPLLQRFENLQHIEIENCGLQFDDSDAISSWMESGAENFLSIKLKTCPAINIFNDEAFFPKLEIVLLDGMSFSNDMDEIAPSLREIYAHGLTSRGNPFECLTNLKNLEVVELRGLQGIGAIVFENGGTADSPLIAKGEIPPLKKCNIFNYVFRFQFGSSPQVAAVYPCMEHFKLYLEDNEDASVEVLGWGPSI